MKITVNITDDSLNELVARDLKDFYDNLSRDLKNRPNVKHGVYHNDKKKDIAEIKQIMAALKLVLEMYGVKAK